MPSITNGTGEFLAITGTDGKIYVLMYSDGKGHIGLYFANSAEYVVLDTKDGYLILKVDSLPTGKKAVFTSEEICLARTAVNQLRNKKIKQGQYTDATDDMPLKLI